MSKHNLWLLLGKQLNGEITEKEREELHTLIRQDKKNLSWPIEFLEDLWRTPHRGRKVSHKAKSRSWERVTARISDEEKMSLSGAVRSSRRKKFLGRFPGYKAAAAVLVLFGVTYFLMRGGPGQKPLKSHVVSVGDRATKRIELPDHTIVWLNSGSSLTYNDGFGAINRNVELEGEAYFEVAHDASIPFKVRTTGVTVKVLGTVFNVKAYRDEPEIQTTLITGRVQVSLNDNPQKKILLVPHEKLTVMRNNDSAGRRPVVHGRIKKDSFSMGVNKLNYQVQTLTLNPADSNYFVETAWVKNKMPFVNEPFEEVAKDMGRRYGVHFIFRDKSLEKVEMSGIFDKETLQQALDVLQMITPFHCQMNGDSIYLYKKPKK